MMSQRLFIVYRERPDSAPKAIDAMADVTEANRIIGLFDWYGAIADTPEEAIKEFEEYEKSKPSTLRCSREYNSALLSCGVLGPRSRPEPWSPLCRVALRPRTAHRPGGTGAPPPSRMRRVRQAISRGSCCGCYSPRSSRCPRPMGSSTSLTWLR